MKPLEILKKLQIDVKKDIKVEGVEVFGHIDTVIDEAIVELEELEIKESCSSCKNKLLCKKAENIKLNWGFKLSEMWFNCWESK